jgi:small subunit ribosomal protein S9
MPKKKLPKKNISADGTLFGTGKRKRAVARAALRSGKGVVRINGVPLAVLSDDLVRLRIQEPLLILGDAAKPFDITVTVTGGGPNSQAEAARMAVARCLADQLGDDARKQLLSYDRNMLIYDPRRTETHKPPHSSWGARRYKQRSKR